MKDNLTSRIIAKKYRNGKKYMTIVVDYFGELGQRRQKSKGTGITLEQYQRDGKKKVEVMRQEFVKQIEKEQTFVTADVFNPEKITLFEFFEYFQELRRNTKSRVHWENGNYYFSLLKLYLCQQDMLLKDFTPKRLLAFLNHEENRKMKNGEKISASTFAHVVTYYITAFRLAWKNDWIKHDLSKHITKPQPDSHEKRFLKEQDYYKLLNMEVKDRRDAIIKLDVLLGLRRSELLGLQEQDIDRRAMKLYVRRKILYSAQHGFEVSTKMKTQTSKRRIAIDKLELEQIDWLLADSKANKEKLVNLYNAEFLGCNDWLCVNQFGELYKPDALSGYMIDLCKKLEIPYCNFHGLRHTCASVLSLTGATPQEMKDQLGHSNIGTTIDTYTELFDAQMENMTARRTDYIANRRFGQN